jgi:hypothetical protein
MEFITAVLPVGEGGMSALPDIEAIEGEDMTLGLRIRSNDTETLLYFNKRAAGYVRHRNGNNIINGWDTDALILGITRPAGTSSKDPDAASRFFLAFGSYLRRDDTVIFESLSKVTTVFEPGDTPEIQISGQPLINAGYYVGDKPAAMVVNGASLDENDFTYDDVSSAAQIHIDNRKWK